MNLWIQSTDNNEESHLYIINMSTIMLKDNRFTWSFLPGRSGRNKFFVRKNSSIRNPNGDPYAALIERETLPQFEWPAAALFVSWIEENNTIFQGKNILELGSGTGIVGLSTAAYARRVVLSDCSLVSLAMLKLTTENDYYENCSLGLLRWGSDESVDELKASIGLDAFDVVIGSDIFYFSTTLNAGLKTAKRALQSLENVSIGYFLCASVARSERMEFDLENVPSTLGFESQVLIESGAFKLYKWTLKC